MYHPSDLAAMDPLVLLKNLGEVPVYDLVLEQVFARPLASTSATG